jgi:hypothetical protein
MDYRHPQATDVSCSCPPIRQGEITMDLACSYGLCRGVAASVLLAAAGVSGMGELLPVAETEDGFVFSLRTGSIKTHALGYSAQIRAKGPTARRLTRSDPASPEFQAMESTWVVACDKGTFAIVEDRFYGADGETVAVLKGDAADQDPPVTGSVSHMVLIGLCGYIRNARK